MAKPTGKEPESRARPTEFGPLLRWQLDRGTRPPGPHAGRGPWTQKEFAEVTGVEPRTVYNWLTNKGVLSSSLPVIETALFGPDRDTAKEDRDELRDAYARLRQHDPSSTSSRPARAPLRSNLSEPPHCVGRDDDIASLVSALIAGAGGGAALVYGGPGFGKTTVTEKVATHKAVIARFGPRRWLVELAAQDTADGMLAAIAAAIGLAPTADRNAVLLQLGAKPTLLVLDNLETPWHGDPRATEQLLRELRSEPALALIASLRGDRPVAGVAWDARTQLSPLLPGVSKDLFRSIAPGIGEQDPDLDFFLQRTAGIPLAITLIARRAASQSSLARLRRAWAQQGLDLAVDLGGKGTREGDLAACIEFSLRSSRLHAPGKRLFAMLGQLPAGLGVEDAEALLGRQAFDAEDQLRLVGLLYEREGRLDLLPPIREVALRHPPNGHDGRRWVAHYLAIVRENGDLVGKQGSAAAVELLMAELPNIAAAMLATAETASGLAEATALLGGLARAMRYVGAKADPLLDALAQRCREHGNRSGEADCLIAQAGTAGMRSDNERASSLFQAALATLDGSDDDQREADCLRGLAAIARMQSRHVEAGDLYRQALERYGRAGALTGEADCLSGLAAIARMQDRYEEAGDLYRQALERYGRAGALTGEAQCLWGLAEIARMQDRYVEAGDLYRQALERYGRAGALTGEAYCLAGLGEMAERAGERDRACRLYRNAEAKFRKVGQLDWLNWVRFRCRNLGCPPS